MIYSPRFTALLDACILYPVTLRDLLLRFAEAELYKPKWTDLIQEEWVRNVQRNRPELLAEKLEKTRQDRNEAFPDATIENFEFLIDSLTLPDPNDRHVLAAAVRANVDVIVTANLKDFPAAYLAQFDLEVQRPEAFVSNIIDLNPGQASFCRASSVS